MACAPCEARRQQLQAEMQAALDAAQGGRPLEAVTTAIVAGTTAVIGLAEMVGLKAKQEVSDDKS